jgi:molybdopterin-guanine dinucleotide biosynthesis protein A
VINKESICGVILAGGQGKRMGGHDKGLVNYHGQPLIEQIINRLKPQLDTLMINANRHLDQYQSYGLPVFTDQWNDYRGPLAGIASAIHHTESEYLLFTPCDTPHLPTDLVQRLIATLDDSKITIVRSPSGLQPLCCLLHRSLADNLDDYLEQGGRRVQEWVTQQNCRYCDYESDEPFANINSLEDR